MKFVSFVSVVLVTLGFSVSAFSQTNIDYSAYSCAMAHTQTDGEDSTASACSTAGLDGVEIRYDSAKFALFANPAAAGGEIGASFRILPKVDVGILVGNESSSIDYEDSADVSSNSDHYAAFGLLRCDHGELTAGAFMSQGDAEVNTQGLAANLKVFLPVGGLQPFVNVSGSYTDIDDKNDTSILSGEVAVGIRSTL